MPGPVDRRLSTLAARLAPYIRQIVGDMMGGTGRSGAMSGDDSLTYIRGYGIPIDDETGNRGTGSFDMQSSRDSADQTASGNDSVILGGESNTASGTVSAALGSGAIADNSYQLSLGGYAYVKGDSQSSISFIGSDCLVTSSWNDLCQWTIRDDTAWTFSMLIVGIEHDCARVYSYRVDGCVENCDGTLTIHAATVTTIYEDDSNYDIQCAIVGSTLRVQVIDSGNEGRTSRWHIRADTAEVSWV